MQNKDKITIVMPVYNAGKFLLTTIESIIQQTYTNFELIAVDDYSTDDSFVILQKFAKEEKRIKAIKNNQSKGVIEALQTAIAQSTGDFITRMDADDLMIDNKLEVMHRKLKQYGEGHVAIGQVKYFSDSKTIGEGYKNYENWLNAMTSLGSNYDGIYTECTIPSPCWMLHRSDFEKCGGFSSNTYPEDYDLAFRMLAAGLTIIPEQKTLHLWRDHAERASRNDCNYSDNSFIPLKVRYFLKLHHERPIAIWGAGRKGKHIVQELLLQGIEPTWYCNNRRKIGKEIYNIQMQSEKALLAKQRAVQVVVAVSSPDEKRAIHQQLLVLGWVENKDFFFFV
jgi:glycosyltransferase involved in cell wall biosynthesis